MKAKNSKLQKNLVSPLQKKGKSREKGEGEKEMTKETK